MVLEAESERHLRENDSAGVLGVFTAIILTIEFMIAMWIQGIPFTAALFGLMTLGFGTVTGAVYLVAGRTAGSEGRQARYATAKGVLVIGLISSACMALLAGIFALPLLFNGGWRSQHLWRAPATLGSSDAGPRGRA